MDTYGVGNTTNEPFRRPWRRRLVRLLIIIAIGLGVSALGSVAMAATSPSPGDDPEAGSVLNQLVYTIRTRYNGGNGTTCAGEKLKTAVIGVPTPVDMGGSILPDAIVTVVAVPGVGNLPDMLELLVVKSPLRLTPLRGLVEVIVTPDAADPGRIALGYDACAGGAPTLFSATAKATDTKITANVLNVLNAGPELTLIGSTFDAAGATRVDPTAVSARLAPVPVGLEAIVNTTAPSNYEATVHTSIPTDLRLQFTDVKGTSRTDAVADIRTFPKDIALVFNPAKVQYTATAPMAEVDFSVTSASAGSDTTRIEAALDDAPLTGLLQRPSPTRVTFTTPHVIGSAAVDFASFDPALTPPTLASLADQFVVVETTDDYTVAKARLFGLSDADIDTDDPLVVDVAHTAGPFHVKAKTPKRTLKADIVDLPSTAFFTFSPTSQDFAYNGSASIAKLDAEVTSVKPFVDEATISRLKIRDFPTGMSGQLDTDNKKMKATLTGGAVGLLEAQVTSGPDEQLPAGVDGLVLEDHVGTYALFVRVTGLQRADVSWGATKRADIVHTAGPFDIHLDLDDLADLNPSPEIEAHVELRDLPATALFEFAPGDTETKITYNGSGAMNSLTLDAAAAEKLFEDATEAHIKATSIPIGMNMTINDATEQMVATTTGGALGKMEATFCGGTTCGPMAIPAHDGMWVEDFASSYKAFARISGLSSLAIGFGDPVTIDAAKTAGPFDISVIEDRFVGEFSDLIYEARTSVEIRNLPAEVALSYSPKTQALSYDGSATIGSIDAHYGLGPIVESNGNVFFPEYITGRATVAHLVVEDLPTGIHLAFNFDVDTNETLAVNAGGGVIGRVELELLSDATLLEVAALAASPIVSGGADGLVIWDLDDFDTTAKEPVEDPYAIVVRATKLQSFSYAKTTPEDHLTARAVSLNRQGGADLYMEVNKANAERFPAVLDGMAQSYKFEFLQVNYADPPDTMTLLIDRFDGDDKDTLLSYYGSEDGAALSFRTNAGEREFHQPPGSPPPQGFFVDPLLEVSVAPVPAGTFSDPGIFGCISSNTMNCALEADVPQGTSDELSVAIEVNSPVHVDMFKRSGIDTVDVVLDIDAKLTASKETNPDGVDSTFVFVDTDGAFVTGTVTQHEGTDRDFSAHITPGFQAFDRLVEMEIFSVGHVSGSATCPVGFDMEHDIGINLEDKWCPGAKIDDVQLPSGEPAALKRGETSVIHVFGRQLSPSVCAGAFPPCAGPDVWFGSTTDPSIPSGTGVTVLGTVWLGIDHLAVTVQVAPDAGLGTVRINARNPQTNHQIGACDCFTVFPVDP